MAILEPLSYKQQKFCEEYLLSFNAYRAALSAGYTDNTARKGDLLHVPKIQAYLKEAMSRSAARAELTHDMLLRELMKVAFCNMGNYYDDHGDPKRMHQLTDDEKAAISYFQRADVTGEDGHITGELFKIKLHNKMAAIDKLCRHTGFYKANWQPHVVLQPEETEEDVAFEAESAKTVAEPFTDEVSGELLEQAGVLSPESEVLSLESEVLSPELGVLTTPSLGKGAVGGVVAVRCIAIMHNKFTPPYTLPLGGNRARPALPLAFVVNETRPSDESLVCESDNILTLSPLDIESRCENQEPREDMALQHILTLSPLKKESRIENQEPREIAVSKLFMEQGVFDTHFQSAQLG